jgi:hypothetical protein
MASRDRDKNGRMDCANVIVERPEEADRVERPREARLRTYMLLASQAS